MPAGRPQFEPTDKQRGEVEAFSLAGFTHDQIAECLGIDKGTLEKHFRAELNFSSMRMLAKVARNVYRAALGAPAQYDDNGNCIRAEVLPQAWAMCFVMKTRGKKMGWTERVEHTGPDGGAIQVQFDFSQLTDDELDTVERARLILARIAPAGYLDGDQPTAH